MAKLGRGVAKLGRWVAKLRRWVAKLERGVAKLGRWVAKLGRWVDKLGRWVAKLVSCLIAVEMTLKKSEKKYYSQCAYLRKSRIKIKKYPGFAFFSIFVSFSLIFFFSNEQFRLVSGR